MRLYLLQNEGQAIWARVANPRQPLCLWDTRASGGHFIPVTDSISLDNLDFRIYATFVRNNTIISNIYWTRSEGGLLYFDNELYTYDELANSILEKYNMKYTGW